MTDDTLSPQDAAEWFLVINAPEQPSGDTLQAWLRWMETSDANRQAFEDIALIWHNTPSAVIARSPGSHHEPGYDGSVPIAEWRAAQVARSLNSPRAARPVATLSWRRPLPAIAATVIFIAVGFASYQKFSSAPISKGEFTTSTAEIKQLSLADGSQITLGGHSKLTVDFESAKREIRLDAGEAYFNVDKDPTRPFVVLARQGAITAIGTAFNVRTVEDRVTVTVTEGSVAVTDADSVASAHSTSATPLVLETRHLAQGEQLTYSPGKKAAALETTGIKHVNAGGAARWREGWLVYRDETLQYVIADIARYTDLQVTVADSAANVQFSGAVSKDHIAEWLAALPDVTPLSVKRTEQGFTIATR